MTNLELACKIANHSRVQLLVHRQRAMRNSFIRDYGDKFSANGGMRGINRWTPRQEAEYNALMERAAAVRAALREHYSNAA